MIEIAEERGKASGAVRVSRISLVVGERSGYISESIRMYFDLIARDTICENAELDIRTVKPLLRCPACGTEFERVPFSFACPACGTDGMPTEAGKEFYIEEIEIE